MSADSETASYTSVTALSDSERQPCPIAGVPLPATTAGKLITKSHIRLLLRYPNLPL